MEMRRSFLLTISASLVVAGVAVSLENPVVSLSYGSFRGQILGQTTQFLGLPFAAPPIGERRFGFPEPPIHFNETKNATEFGASCPQQAIQVPKDSPFQFPPHNTSEDCLFINVFRPANMSQEKLPVLFWIPGGGFQVGGSALYPGFSLINRSLTLGKPIIFVTINYRLNAFGFLAGKEVKEKGLTNVGLHDQRFALEWVQEHIACFGGDPTKVTIWGESAGAISVGLQLLLNEGNPSGLFTAAIMESGSPGLAPGVLDQQIHFDNLVESTNCTNATDRFECLRQAPFAALQSGVDASPSLFSFKSLNLTWLPVVDGTLIPSNPLKLVKSGKYAKVPIIMGDNEDQGTLFSQASLNITTNAEFIEYIKSNYFSFITDEQMDALAAAYPDDVTQGSPFGTGTSNAKTPEYKRIAALQGDMIFQAPRRAFLEEASKTQPAYSYRYARDGTFAPTYGTFHGIELSYFFSFDPNQTDYIATDAILYFANTHDPNPPNDSISLLRNTHWRMWNDSECCPPLLSFFDPPPTVNITEDTYRRGAMSLLNQLLLVG